jgi:hypothetical protein
MFLDVFLFLRREVMKLFFCNSDPQDPIPPWAGKREIIQEHPGHPESHGISPP